MKPLTYKHQSTLVSSLLVLSLATALPYKLLIVMGPPAFSLIFSKRNRAQLDYQIKDSLEKNFEHWQGNMSTYFLESIAMKWSFEVQMIFQSSQRFIHLWYLTFDFGKSTTFSISFIIFFYVLTENFTLI